MTNPQVKGRLWDKNGNLIADLKGLAEVTQAAFVPNSNKLMLAGCDEIVKYHPFFPNAHCSSNSLRLYDYTGNMLSILRDEIRDLWISPDGKLLITATDRYRGNGKFWRFVP